MGAVTAEDFSAFVHRAKDGSDSFDVAVRGARCANCMAKIEGGVKAIGGVAEARLNLSTGKLHVVWRGDAVHPAAVLGRIHALGYEAAPFDAAGQMDANDAEGRHLLRCLAVAGFGTVFVVGLTDAVWYSNGDIGVHRALFFWLAGLVSIPLTLYAAEPFFTSAFRALAKRQTNMDVPIGAAILLALALSVWQTAAGGAETYFDAAIMLAFVLLVGRYLDFRLRDRAAGAARHLVTLQSALARRLKDDGTLETVAARELAPGDRVLLASGERVPADGILEDRDAEIDVSLVTGESQPVIAAAGQTLRAGTINLGRPVVLRITAKMDDSLVADLARLLEAGRQTRSLYIRLADRAARAYVPFVAIASLAVFAGWALSGAGLDVAVTNAIAVLIITCPCALGLAVPAVQIVATGRLFAKGVFVKSGDALERLAEIDTAVFDKTGTLTLGTPVLSNEVPPKVLDLAARLARASRHPLSRALAEAAGPGPVAVHVREVAGSGLEAEIDGAVCRLGNADWCGVTSEHRAGELWFRAGGAPAQRFDFRDHIRPETKATIAAFAPRRIAVEMLTGDHAQPASGIAKEAGIARWRADVGPAEKAARLEELRKQGHRTLMVGDGINDAGALALAHVSIAPGSAADVSQRASDLVLRGDGIAPIVEAIDIARKARRLVLENFAFAAVYNLAAVPVAALGLVNPLIAAAAMAGSSLIVTLNALRLARP
jgi:Cu2+-exporting ATPase